MTSYLNCAFVGTLNVFGTKNARCVEHCKTCFVYLIRPYFITKTDRYKFSTLYVYTYNIILLCQFLLGFPSEGGFSPKFCTHSMCLVPINTFSSSQMAFSGYPNSCFGFNTKTFDLVLLLYINESVLFKNLFVL